MSDTKPNPEPIRTIYEALPADVQRKVSLHDLKRICDAVLPKEQPADRAARVETLVGYHPWPKDVQDHYEDLEARYGREKVYWTREKEKLLAQNNKYRVALIKLQIGSCSCLTKTPELEFHNVSCPYRIAAEALKDTIPQRLDPS